MTNINASSARAFVVSARALRTRAARHTHKLRVASTVHRKIIAAGGFRARAFFCSSVRLGGQSANGNANCLRDLSVPRVSRSCSSWFLRVLRVALGGQQKRQLPNAKGVPTKRRRRRRHGNSNQLFRSYTRGAQQGCHNIPFDLCRILKLNQQLAAVCERDATTSKASLTLLARSNGGRRPKRTDLCPS